jgi:aminoglycoside 6'-N-acetyltransferase I
MVIGSVVIPPCFWIIAAAMRVVPATFADREDWSALRRALWPDADDGDIARMLKEPARFAAFIAYETNGSAIGFAEASLRHDYVNGCDTSPVGFLEGIYVAPLFRRRGVAASLVSAVEQWTLAQGAIELASDALIDNVDSHRMHAALGFEETERVVSFRKFLG